MYDQKILLQPNFLPFSIKEHLELVPQDCTTTMSLSTEQGLAPFQVDSISTTCQTWFKVVGDLKASDATPLIILHGGPGACHEYLLLLEQLASPCRPVVFYDQIGNGRSTHLRHLRGDQAFWTVELFMDELTNLLAHLGLESRTFDLHGQSWGGMLGAEYAIRGRHRAQIRKLVLANSLASNVLYRQGMDVEIKKFPQNIQDAIAKAKHTGEYDTEECNGALDYFMRRLLSVAQPWPVPGLATALEWLMKDDTTYFTMYAKTLIQDLVLLSANAFADMARICSRR